MFLWGKAFTVPSWNFFLYMSLQGHCSRTGTGEYEGS